MLHLHCMTREELNELSIFALREFARRTGVYAPTSRKKEELINEIIEISEGRKQPHISKTKQGRPPKNYGYPFAESFVPQQSQVYPSTYLRQESKFTYNDDIKTITGYLELNQNSSLLWGYQNNRMVCIQMLKGLVQEYNLKTGDLLLVEVGGANHDVAESVLTINNTPVKNHNKNRIDYSQMEHQTPNKFLGFSNVKFKDFDIKLGESVYLYGSNNMDNSLTISEMLSDCDADRKLYVNTSIVDKNRCVLSGLEGVEKFVTEFSDPIDHARRIVMLATERAKRVIEKGESCVLAIDDVQSVRGIDVEDLHMTKNLMSLTKNCNDSGSVSLLAIMPSGRSMDMFEKLADKRFKVIDRKLFLID